jgi:hypothetical protein
MSTRSNIAIYNTETETAQYVHVHSDGYYSGVGATLKEHYQDVEKVKKLIAGGNISSLEKEVDIPEGVQHDFDSRDENVTTFYGRDRGDTGDEAQTINITKENLPRLRRQEYLYVYLELEEKWIATHTEAFINL